MLTPARASSSLAVWVAVLVTATLIVLRSLVFVHYEQADFDADQAIVGLMATHLAEGRAWPLFFYGQLYMMGVQAWMAALVFPLIGPTVFALKLPLVIVNVATGGLLVWLLVRETALRPWQATTAAAWFALLPPVTASRMVQAQGGTIEPLLYTLLLWLARRRAVIFGLLFAFGFLHREFTLFAVIAIVLLEVWTGELFSRRRASHWLVVVLVFLGSRQAVTLLRHIASMFGPDVPPPRLEDGITNVDLVARSVCLSAGPMLGNLWWLIAHNVPTFFGVQSQPPGALILSHQATGAPWAAWPAIVAMACALLVVASRAWRSLPPLRAPADSRVLLPAMLCVAGFLSLVGVATGCNIRNLFTIRYHLLLAFAPVGLTALAFALNDQRSHDPGPSASGARAQAGTRVVLPLMTAAVLVWATAMLGEHVRLLREYRTSPPANAFRALADDLVAHGDKYGWASYWVSYHVDFLSQERVQLSPTSAIRIADYTRQALRAGSTAVVVGSAPCSSGESGRQVAVWWVCRGTSKR
ncbi:hypothetical protein [Luteitalea pratensis]|uniref:hypothetical protein n=1 Tax=Luteitalea pratensis TaxID=1855912 RepID=UPI000D726450|nr:hypothetical protein [Luteitalea pratensis]